MIMTFWLARQDKTGRQLAGTQFEQQSVARRGRHVAQRRCGAQDQAGQQGPYGKVSNGGSEYHASKDNGSGSVRKLVLYSVGMGS